MSKSPTTILADALLDRCHKIERLRAINAELVAALEGLNAAFLCIKIEVPASRMSAILAASEAARTALTNAQER